MNLTDSLCWFNSPDFPKFDLDSRNRNAIIVFDEKRNVVNSNFRQGSIPGCVAAVRQNAGKLAMIGETRVLANCGYDIPICQTLSQAQFSVRACHRSSGFPVRARLRSEQHERVHR
jgi:hypothetical protein